MEFINGMLITDSAKGRHIIPLINVKFIVPNGSDKTIIHLITNDEIPVNLSFDKVIAAARQGMMHGKVLVENMAQDV